MANFRYFVRSVRKYEGLQSQPNYYFLIDVASDGVAASGGIEVGVRAQSITEGTSLVLDKLKIFVQDFKNALEAGPLNMDQADVSDAGE